MLSHCGSTNPRGQLIGQSKCSQGFCKPEECQSYDARCPKTNAPDKLIFILEWFDREADLVKKFMLMYYDIDGTVEIMDMTHKRRFLRRLKVDTVTFSELYLENVINIYSRQMTVVEYADSCTSQYMEPRTQRAFLLIKPEAIKHLGNILMEIEKNFRVLRAKMCTLTKYEGEKFYDHYNGQECHTPLVEYITSGPVVAFIVIGHNSIERLKTIVGKQDPEVARLETPTCLRALYGSTFVNNGFEISESPACVERDAAFFFTKCRININKVASSSVKYDCSTCCIIKPHAVKERLAGRIICDIGLANFKITAFEMFYLDLTHAEEFHEIYKGVLSHYSMMTQALTLGPCYALEISGCGPETQKLFRDFVGPMDTDIARKLRPTTLRAKYGRDKVNNAIHCTDLPADTNLELDYLFGILQMLV